MPVAMGTDDVQKSADDQVINALNLAEKERLEANRLRTELQTIRTQMEKLSEDAQSKVWILFLQCTCLESHINKIFLFFFIF